MKNAMIWTRPTVWSNSARDEQPKSSQPDAAAPTLTAAKIADVLRRMF
jgi:hypothetical protein